MRDVATACDLLRPVWDRTEGHDGYVSIEVDPNFAYDTTATITQATHFHEAIARPNLLVKIPATDAGLPAIEEMTARGYAINVTSAPNAMSRRRARRLSRLVAPSAAVAVLGGLVASGLSAGTQPAAAQYEYDQKS
jgi:transaldolase